MKQTNKQRSKSKYKTANPFIIAQASDLNMKSSTFVGGLAIFLILIGLFVL